MSIFTVTPAFDRYNGQPILSRQTGAQCSRIEGYCRHLSAGASSTLYVHAADAQAWVDTHEAQFHGHACTCTPSVYGQHAFDCNA